MKLMVANSCGRLTVFYALNLLMACRAGGQEACRNGMTIDGSVIDPTGAAIIGAQLTLDQDHLTQSGKTGGFVYPCLALESHILKISAAGFAERTVELSPAYRAYHLKLVMKLESVRQEVDVTPSSKEISGAGERTLSEKQIADLADDPDDFLRQLQTLAAGAGGMGGVPLITVDGFRLESRVPPKNSIAFIRINPDLYSAEFMEAPYEGGRVEIYTKPGQSRIHGDAFLTLSNSVFNAKDPLSTSKAALGKRRVGFDLSGPLARSNQDFSLSLEQREIRDFGVIKATTLDSAGNRVPLVANVPTPQHLWEASARASFLTSPRNVLIASYTANVNHLENVTAGGTTLSEAGYSSSQSEHTIRLSNVTTFNPRLMHEARASVRYRDEHDYPNSSATQIQVAGAFTSGGAAVQNLRVRETALQILDDIILTRHKHSLKAGVQVDEFFDRNLSTQGFNGSYFFGGGSAPALDSQDHPIPGSSVTIDGLEQYRRALRMLPGGAATTFAVVSGSNGNNFNQFRAAIYLQDQWKIAPKLQISGGLRYALQSNPSSVLNLAPRVGVSWSPDNKKKWSLSGHLGLFQSPVATTTVAEARRLNGIQRTLQTVYSATYGTALANQTVIGTVRSFASSPSQTPSLQSQIAIEYSGPHGWNFGGSWLHTRLWNGIRTRNINAPLNDLPQGPRPGKPNENILQFQQSGSLKGDTLTLSVSNSSLKRVQLYALYVHVSLQGNMEKDPAFSPQSTRSDAGEWSQLSGRSANNFVTTGQITLPSRLILSHVFRAVGDAPYNLITGLDRNGDGNFNDRPQYASASTQGAIGTRYGWLVADGGNGDVPRNRGGMPWGVYLDANLSHRFVLNPKAGDDRRQTLTFNLRSANLLNHTNVTTMGNVLGSPSFDRPIISDAGRRIELGARYAF